MYEEISKSDDFDLTYSLLDDKDELTETGDPIVHKSITSRGQHQAPHERAVGAARHVKAGTINRYYIKKDSTGVLYDPTDVTARSEATKKRNGNPVYYMQSVKAAQFKSYLQFLKTKDRRHLIQARQTY